ncbi:MAG: glycosyl hydrolase-related protein, partial [Candidatus Rifleibacteriota bacterium]
YLLPNGCDHMPPQKELPSLLKALNEKNPDLPLIQSSFPEFIEALRSESCPHDQYAGDLLGNLHHPILLSVYSTRMYLKQQNRRAEYFLIKIAEPLLANLGKIVRTADSKPFLDLAWRLLLRNHAHDDICGCSIDEVHDENEVRFAEIISIARTLITEALESLVLTGITATDNTDRKSPAANVFIFNPHPFSVRTRISCTFMIPNPGGEFSEPTRQSGITAISGSGRTLPVSVDASEAMVARSAYLETTWGRRYQVSVPLEMPALGYQIVRFSENGEMNPVNPAADVPMIDTDNILLEATLRQLSLSDRKSGQRFAEVLCFEYEDDAGDTYSFGPVAGRQPQHATIQDAAWSPKKGGLLAITYRLASEMPSDSKPSHREIPVEIKVEVQPGLENGLEFRVTYENTRPGGRLRALLPAGTDGDSLWADSHFLLAQHQPPENFEPQRPYPGEKQYDTFHQHEFAFTENGDIRTWIANRGNPEIALVKRNNQSWFALTLHRSVEMLSVTGGGIRQCGAGPAIPVPGARCLRNFEHAFAWGTGKLSKSEVVRLATAFANPVYNQELPYLPQAPETGPVPRFHSFFELDDAMVRISACRPWHSHGLATRVYNMSDQVKKIRLKTGFSGQTWCLADLDEKWNAATEKPLENGCIVFAINPYAIRTVIIK